MRVREFRGELSLPSERLFPFFRRAANLEAVPPPWMHFHRITPQPIVMREGALIDWWQPS